MTIIILSSLALYFACVGFYHASPKRTAFDCVKSSKPAQQVVSLSCWALAVFALIGFIYTSGWEHGLAIWVGLFAAAGIASLLISALLPKHHIKSTMAALGLSGLAYVIGVIT
ncbi:MAG: hypothetical protein AAF926_02605 [Pseudomonadota bacterium]